MYQHIKLTKEQAQLVHKQELAEGWSFLVTNDINGDYFLDPYQVEHCFKEEFQWLKQLPLSEYVPLPADIQLTSGGNIQF
jgi:hypothetical protein